MLFEYVEAELRQVKRNELICIQPTKAESINLSYNIHVKQPYY